MITVTDVRQWVREQLAAEGVAEPTEEQVDSRLQEKEADFRDKLLRGESLGDHTHLSFPSHSHDSQYEAAGHNHGTQEQIDALRRDVDAILERLKGVP